MKKNFKLFVCSLAAFLGASQLIACGGGDGQVSIESFPDNSEHGGVVEETEYKIVQDGVSAYKLVIPVDADTKTKKAAAEFDAFFGEATGIKLETITDAEATWSETAKYISLGDTELLDEAGVEIVFAELCIEDKFSMTVKNRLYKSAGNKVIYV